MEYFQFVLKFFISWFVLIYTKNPQWYALQLYKKWNTAKKIDVLKPQTLVPRKFLGIYRRNSEEDKGFLGISSEYSEEFRGNRVFKPKTTFCGLNNTYITLIKCLGLIMKSNICSLPYYKHFSDCMNEIPTT